MSIVRIKDTSGVQQYLEYPGGLPASREDDGCRGKRGRGVENKKGPRRKSRLGALWGTENLQLWLKMHQVARA